MSVMHTRRRPLHLPRRPAWRINRATRLRLQQLARVYGQSVNNLLRDRPQLAPFAPQFRSQRVQCAFLPPKSGVVRRFQHLRTAGKPFTFADLLVLAHDYGVSVEAMALRLEELRLLQSGTADKLKAGKNRIRAHQRELGLPPIPGNDGRSFDWTSAISG